MGTLLKARGLAHLWLGIVAVLACDTALGVIVDPSQPAVPRQERIAAGTLQFRSAGGNLCSATAVGTRALMTAANCIGSGSKVVAQVGDEEYTLQCTRLAEPGEVYVDIALCASERPFRSLRPARVELGRALSPGETVLLAGYGCATPNAEGQLASASYTQGPARVVFFGASADRELHGVTRGSVACFGDAGGGVYRLGAAPVLVAVLSRTDLLHHSWVVPTGVPQAADRIRQWSIANRVGICGMNADAADCGAADSPATAGAAPANVVVLRRPGAAEPVPVIQAKGQLVKAQGSSDESVASAFERVCGMPARALPGVTADQLAAYGQTRGRPGEVFEIPVCPVVPTAVAAARPTALMLPATTEKRVQPGDTVWSLFKAMKDGDATPTPAGRTEFADYERKFKDANPTVANPGQLKVNEVVNVPPVVTASLAPLPVVAPAPPVPVAATQPPQALPILSLSNVEAEAACKTQMQSSSHPYDLGLLLDLMAMNRKLDFTLVAPVAVMVADSGIEGAGSGIFSMQVLSKRRHTDFKTHADSIAPQVLNAKAKSHGTIVASVALGGPIFSRVSPSAQPRIQLGIQRIYFTPVSQQSSDQDGVTANTSLFDELIKTAENTEAMIVNLSLRSTVPIPAIETNARNNSSRLLFVTAAGNQGKQLGRDGGTDVEATYPALNGGLSEQRVITVMALDGQGKRATFSNWGESYVDIAAPGCNVPALAWDKELGRFVATMESGTSLATPLVSFAAALVRSESNGEFSPALIKRRLLVSADLAPETPLLQEVSDGRKLNIPKAVAIRNDVIELANRKLLVGDLRLIPAGGTQELRPTDLVVMECEKAKTLRVMVQHLLKISFWLPGTDGPRFRVYYQRGRDTELFADDVCTAPSSMRIEVKKTSGDTMPVEWKDLKDIVMRHVS